MNSGVEIPKSKIQISKWLSPAFFLALFAVFILAPFSLKDKLDAVCFGI